MAQGLASAAPPETGDQPGFIPVSLTEPLTGGDALQTDTAPVKPAVTAGLDLDLLLPAGRRDPGQSIVRRPRPLPAASEAGEDATALGPVVKPGTYLVIGSFQNSENATKLGREHGELNAAVMTLETSGRKMYRVVAGPIGDGELGQARARFLQAGIRNTWSVRLCQDNLALPPCRETMLQQAQLPSR